jgi:hypothetical protein
MSNPVTPTEEEKEGLSSKIPPWMRASVVRRDGYRCIAPTLDGNAGWCRDAFGTVITRWGDRDPGPQYLQMSHTKDEGELSLGKKADTDAIHMVALCPFHHTGTIAGSNWEAANRWRIRRYLDQFKDPVKVKGKR